MPRKSPFSVWGIAKEVRALGFPVNEIIEPSLDDWTDGEVKIRNGVTVQVSAEGDYAGVMRELPDGNLHFYPTHLLSDGEAELINDIQKALAEAG